MFEPRPSSHRPDDYLNRGEVVGRISEALSSHTNPLMRSLAGSRDFIDELLSAVNPVRAARTIQVGVFASICTLASVDSPKRLAKIHSLLFDPEIATVESRALVSIRGFFSTISRYYSATSFGDVANMCAFLIAVANSAGPEAASLIDQASASVERPGGSFESLDPILLAGDMYAARCTLLPVHQRGRFAATLISLACEGAEISEEALAKCVVEISDLSQEERDRIRSSWKSITAHVNFNGTLFFSVCSMVRQMEWVQGEVALINAAPELSMRLFNSMLGNLEQIDALAELIAPSQPAPSLSQGDLERLVTLLESGVEVAEVAKVTSLSRHYGLSLSEVPESVMALPAEVLSAIQVEKRAGFSNGSFYSGGPRLRPLNELSEIALMLCSMNLEPAQLENMRFINAFVDLHDRSQAVHSLWNIDLARRYAERCAGRSDIDVRGGFTGVRTSDVTKLHLSFSMFKDLSDAGYEKEDALRISWHYANHERFTAPRFREIVECLFRGDPRESLAIKLKEIAEKPEFSDQDFSDALTFAKDVFPSDWKPVRALALTAPKAGLDAPGLIRAAMKGWNGSSMTALIRMINNVLEVGHAASARADLLAFMQAPRIEERKEAGNRLSQIYRTDTGPYPIYLPNSLNRLDPRYKRMVDEVKGVYRGVFDIHYGFGHLTYECQKPPGGSDWMLVRFGLDTSVRVDRLRSEGGDHFPGPGCWISGLRLDRLFAVNPKTPEDPYSLFKAAWPWAARELEELPMSRFLFSRGVRAIVGPSEPKYNLDGIHYSLVAWNEHFKNEMLNAAALVPTDLLFEVMKGRAAPVQEPGERPLVSPDQELNGDYLTFESLVEKSEARGVNVLNLGWPSNLGGLCNAYPPCSSPYFLWEPGVYAETRDHAGHVHKSHILGRYVSTLTPEIDKRMEPMREAHKLVHRLASAYLNLNDLFRLSLSLWHKGLTVTEEMGEDAKLKVEREDGDRRDLGENELRMLKEAHLWNGLHAQGVRERNSFPVLCLAKTLDHWNRVRSSVVLDTYDMTLRLPGEKSVQLTPGTSGTSGFEVGVWSKYVRPIYYSRADLDLRFLDRRVVTYDPNYDPK